MQPISKKILFKHLKNSLEKYTLNFKKATTKNVSFFSLFRRRSAWLDHLFQKLELHARSRLVFRNGKVAQQVRVAHVGCVGVSVHVGRPFPASCVGMSRAYIAKKSNMNIRLEKMG